MTKDTNKIQLLLIMLSAFVVVGCAGTRTLHDIARAGDTVAVAAGWKHAFSPENITVTITPTVGDQVVYPPGDLSVRGVVNLYPDPVSSIIVSRETDQDLTSSARTYATTTSGFTGGDKDWWQTVVFIDLPSGISTGLTTIDISNPQGEVATSTLDIVAGAGSPNPFNALSLGPMTANQIKSLKRVDHYTVSFSGATIPHAIQIDLVHDPDKDNGGWGRAHVVNPVGYIKNVAWSDDGTNLRVIITPARDGIVTDMQDFKIYVAGGVSGLTLAPILSPLQAFDENGALLEGLDEVTAIID